jgi:dTDP-4-amino-4,6-dideoxygalactose transaminase
MKIPLSAPEITEADIAAVEAVLRTSRLSLGPKLEEFESALAQYIGTTHCVAVSSGTAALHLCLRTLGVGEGDEVIAPSFAFVAVANAARYVGAIPVFVDINPETLNLNPERVEEAITSRTRAVLVVHTFGVPAEMTAIRAIAQCHKLLVIEDACEALGAEINGRRAGSFGDVSVFGFYPNKQITTGEGGAIATNDAELARRVRSLRNQGRNSNEWLQHTEVGYNYRISEMNCALGISQLKRIDAVLATRKGIANAYSRCLKNRKYVAPPPEALPDRKISWFAYSVRLAEQFGGERRDAVMKEMALHGIECGRYFAPIHLQPAYREASHRCKDLRVTESIATRMLTLPFFNQITPAQIEEVCGTLETVLDKMAG